MNTSQSVSPATFNFMYGEQGWPDVVHQDDKKSFSSSHTSGGLVPLASISPSDSEFSMETPNMINSWSTRDSYSVDDSIQDPADPASPTETEQGGLEDR